MQPYYALMALKALNGLWTGCGGHSSAFAMLRSWISRVGSGSSSAFIRCVRSKRLCSHIKGKQVLQALVIGKVHVVVHSPTELREVWWW